MSGTSVNIRLFHNGSSLVWISSVGLLVYDTDQLREIFEKQEV